MTAPRPAQPCTAHKSDGTPCRNYAMHGTTVCKSHGGRAPQVKRAAQRRLQTEAAERQLAALQLQVDPTIDPAHALLCQVAATWHMVGHWRTRIEGLAADGHQLTDTEYFGEGGSRRVPLVELDILHTWEQLHGRVCVAALKAGIDERRIKLAETQGQLIAQVIRQTLTDLGIEETPQVAETVARHLTLVHGAA